MHCGPLISLMMTLLMNVSVIQVSLLTESAVVTVWEPDQSTVFCHPQNSDHKKELKGQFREFLFFFRIFRHNMQENVCVKFQINKI